LTKQQKIDYLLKVVGEFIKSTTIDDFVFMHESEHIMSDASFELLDDLHKAYRDIDFFKYEKLVSDGVTYAAKLIDKGDTNEPKPEDTWRSSQRN
jgi:hypothetical protein